MQKGFEVNERDYFKDPLGEDELIDVASTVGLAEIFAWRSPSVKNMGSQGKDLEDREMLQCMLKEPRLIRRPILKVANETIIGANIKVITEKLDTIS